METRPEEFERDAVASGVAALTGRNGLRLGSRVNLSIRRVKRGDSYKFVRRDGRVVRDATRGATTLLKSNVRLEGDCVVLSFRGKGGKSLRKECDAAGLVRAIVEQLRELPGAGLFQYRDSDGSVKQATATQVNAFLRNIAGVKISLKDFRSLMACAAVIESLARVAPAESARLRRRQVLEAVRAAADELANTPAICRRSYVHELIVTAFESRLLERFSSTLKSCRSSARREQVRVQVLSLEHSGSA